MKMRINRDKMYMEVAKIIAQRGTCTRLQVGAIIVNKGGIVAEGYVGAPKGMPHCEGGCGEDGGCKDTVHAEINAIIKAARIGVPIGGGVMYCTHSPCKACAMAIINAGIIELMFETPYRDSAPIELLEKAGIYVGFVS